MNYAELYNKQYANGKIIGSKVPHSGLRRLFAPLNVDLTVEQLAFELLPASRVFLDAGCGEGDLCFMLAPRYERIIGIDVAEIRLTRARERAASEFAGQDKFLFTSANLDYPLPVSDDSVDVLSSLNVVEHVFDLYKLLAEFYRVLKPDGLALLQVPNIAYLRHRLTLVMGRLPVTSSPDNWREIGWDGGHLHYFTMASLCGVLRENGFKILQQSGTGLFGRWRNWRPSLLTGDLVVLAQKA
jgi:SAM-dependent methyltransferase